MGVIYAINRKKQQMIWAHKFSNALVNHVFPLGNDEVICTTMDGKIVKLTYQPEATKIFNP
jgi:hypothetical protein